MAPSTTIGAIILLWRKAATKVIVFHDPSGTVPITLSPFGARPLIRAKFVLTAVSSINTNRAGSSIPCSRIQRRRARATSARCRSAACRLFFKGDSVAIEKTPERATAGSNPSLAQLCDGLHQSQVRLLGDQIEYLLRKRLQRRNASSTRLRRSALAFVPALQPLYRRTHAHLETFSRLAPRRTAFNSFDYAFPQITRIGLRHRPPPQRRINARRIAHPNPFGKPADSNQAGTALVIRTFGAHCQQATLHFRSK